jgi:hypothetical protein
VPLCPQVRPHQRGSRNILQGHVRFIEYGFSPASTHIVIVATPFEYPADDLELRDGLVGDLNTTGLPADFASSSHSFIDPHDPIAWYQEKIQVRVGRENTHRYILATVNGRPLGPFTLPITPSLDTTGTPRSMEDLMEVGEPMTQRIVTRNGFPIEYLLQSASSGDG